MNSRTKPHPTGVGTERRDREESLGGLWRKISHQEAPATLPLTRTHSLVLQNRHHALPDDLRRRISSWKPGSTSPHSNQPRRPRGRLQRTQPALPMPGRLLPAAVICKFLTRNSETQRATTKVSIPEDDVARKARMDVAEPQLNDEDDVLPAIDDEDAAFLTNETGLKELLQPLT